MHARSAFIRRKMDDVDEVVQKAMVDLLERPDTRAALAGTDDTKVRGDNGQRGARARLNLAAENYADGP
jgi:hypothetical protein